MDKEKSTLLYKFRDDTLNYIKHIIRHYSLQMFLMSNYIKYIPDKDPAKKHVINNIIYHPYRPTSQWPVGWFVNVNEIREDLGITYWYIETCIETKIKYIKEKIERQQYPNNNIFFKFLTDNYYYMLIAFSLLILQSLTDDIFLNKRTQYYCLAIKTKFNTDIVCDKEKINKYMWYIFENLLDSKMCSLYSGETEPPAEHMGVDLTRQSTYAFPKKREYGRRKQNSNRR